ncbi:sperm protein associated with the nucleus on the X chromosome N2-like [Hylobates moloch]|uniref:sperm protein associated with the nucleus on the X chromosome N2-like n=1 Tax=Hylobates moloch TaxID=81572 RepID=UPI0026748605|nr:sperm protein associated with the nucleus on the X chromosome N2-like [Hylobates moloch]
MYREGKSSGPLGSFNIAVEVWTLQDPAVDIQQPTRIMEKPTSSTNGEKRKSPCDSNKTDEMQKTPNSDLAPEPSLKKIKTSEYSTVLVLCDSKTKKIHPNQLENDQSLENSINPVQEEEDDQDSAEGSSQEDEDLDSSKGSSTEEEDPDASEGSSEEGDED